MNHISNTISNKGGAYGFTYSGPSFSQNKNQNKNYMQNLYTKEDNNSISNVPYNPLLAGEGAVAQPASPISQVSDAAPSTGSDFMKQMSTPSSFEEYNSTSTPVSSTLYANSNTAQSVESQSSNTLNKEEMRKSIMIMKDQLERMLRVLDGQSVSAAPSQAGVNTQMDPQGSEEVIEGVFNGESMIGPDGKSYQVSPNYASKSKMVEGDMLKLTILHNGKLLYKQIGPTKRRHIRAELLFDPATQNWHAQSEGKLYRILTASVTYYKGKAGDEAMLIIPEDGHSSWAAVDTIISR